MYTTLRQLLLSLPAALLLAHAAIANTETEVDQPETAVQESGAGEGEAAAPEAKAQPAAGESTDYSAFASYMEGIEEVRVTEPDPDKADDLDMAVEKFNEDRSERRKVVCKKYARTGSRVKKTVCRTVASIEEDEAESQKWMKTVQGRYQWEN